MPTKILNNGEIDIRCDLCNRRWNTKPLSGMICRFPDNGYSNFVWAQTNFHKHSHTCELDKLELLILHALLKKLEFI